MTDTQANSNRLARNTALLYLRMLVTLCIGLYTSRLVIRALGIADYGVYDVVAGAVAMFSIFTTSLSTAISRFLTYHLASGGIGLLKRIFSASVTIQLIVASLILIAGMPIGLWAVNDFLDIPSSSIPDANWVLVCAVLSFMVNLLSVPYNAAIIAHERMGAFATISIIETVLKLGAAASLYLFLNDRLAIYGLLQLAVAITTRLCYTIYCRRQFAECHFRFVFDKSILKEMFGFAGWNLFGTTAYIFNTQGVNIISNLFFGVIVNAARGITMHVQSLLTLFANSFTTALNPQITKSYAKGEYEYMFALIVRGSKISFFLMLVISLPIILEAPFLLNLWLGKYPTETIIFVRLALVGTMVDFLGNSTANAVWATGKIRRYYLVTTPVGILVFPISYLLFWLGLPAYTAYIVFICVYALLVPLRLIVLHHLIPQFNPLRFVRRVVLVIIPVSILSAIVPVALQWLLPADIGYRLLVIAASALSVAGCTYFLGLDATEKAFLLSKIRRN